MIFLDASLPGTHVGMVYVKKTGASNMTTCAHHQLRHKNVNFLCIHVKGLVTLKFILLYLALVIFIITDNQDFLPEACISRESHYNNCFLFTSICLSPTVSVSSHLLSYFYTAIFLTPCFSFAFYSFILYRFYLCAYLIFIFAFDINFCI